jgi:hypothetical protein
MVYESAMLLYVVVKMKLLITEVEKKKSCLSILFFLRPIGEREGGDGPCTACMAVAGRRTTLNFNTRLGFLL